MFMIYALVRDIIPYTNINAMQICIEEIFYTLSLKKY